MIQYLFLLFPSIPITMPRQGKTAKWPLFRGPVVKAVLVPGKKKRPRLLSALRGVTIKARLSFGWILAPSPRGRSPVMLVVVQHLSALALRPLLEGAAQALGAESAG